MTSELALTLREGLKYLAAEQAPDGGFPGLASEHERDFRKAAVHPTVFFTALILSSLADVRGSAPVRRQAARFLLRHRSARWTWNYWVRGAAAEDLRRYPDDLDDTCCALAALSTHAPKLVDGRALGHVARQLISAETEPGGPYETWLIDRREHPEWQDVDPAVNANIGYFLSLHDALVPGLEAYISKLLEDNNLHSVYYLGTEPVLYFIARWYRGDKLGALRQHVLQAVRQADTPLKQALLLSSGCRVGLDAEQLWPLMTALASARQDAHWPAEALYYEPPSERGKRRYAGSPALTTAFALEALNLFREQVAAKPSTLPAAERATKPRRRHSDPPSSLEEAYEAAMNKLVQRDSARQISGAADIIAAAGGWRLPLAQRRSLNEGSANGWLAYSLYDDLLDGDGEPATIGVANFAQRRSLQAFQAALPDDRAYQRLVADAFAVVDNANTWEAMNARADNLRGGLEVPRLPEYGDYRQLAERSWGHVLAACGVLAAAGFGPRSVECRRLQRFFRAFLIARQLNDDAHDWEEDLLQGRLSAVVCLLLKDYGFSGGRLNAEKHLKPLRALFWEETFGRVAAETYKQLDIADHELRSCDFLPKRHILEGWLQKLRRATDKAVRGQSEARKFMLAYEESGQATEHE